MNKKRFYLIGCGKAGCAIAAAIANSGHEISFLTDRNSYKAKALASVVSALAYSEEIRPEYVASSDVVMVCVQDRNIPDVADTLASCGANLSGKIFLHISGSVTSGVFSERGIEPDQSASWHPIQTFSEEGTSDPGLLTGIFFGIEGGVKASQLARDLTLQLGSDFIDVPEGKKQLYHTACVAASNFLVTLLNIVAEFGGSAGIDKTNSFRVFKPIIEKTIDNVSSQGLVDSLTGPFERNDVETITKHLESISSELPSLIPFYTLLGMETVRVAFRKESLNMQNVIAILDLMNEYVAKEKNLTDKLEGN